MVSWNEIPSPQVLSGNQTRGIAEGQLSNRRLRISAGLRGKQTNSNQALIWTVSVGFLAIKYSELILGVKLPSIIIASLYGLIAWSTALLLLNAVSRIFHNEDHVVGAERHPYRDRNGALGDRGTVDGSPLVGIPDDMITPPSRGDGVVRTEASPNGGLTESARRRAGAHDVGMRRGSSTPEHINKILDEFDRAADAVVSSKGKEVGGFSLGAGLGDLPGGTTYRPSAVPKGTVSTPVRSDGRVVQSLLSQREAVLEDLGIDDEMLERSIETLREWIACRVLKPLEKAMSVAHKQVMDSAAASGFTGVRLTNLTEIGVEGSQRVADDSLILNQMRMHLEGLLSNPVHSSNVQYKSCLQAIINYQKLYVLLRGEFLPLLPPAPDGYVLQRISDLANGTCMIDFNWNSGGELNGKQWSTDLPTDSALVLYLFSAYLTAPQWKFSDEDQCKIEGSADVLYLGRLPPRVKGQFTAVLPTRLPKGAKGTSIQGLQLGSTAPHFSLSVQGDTLLTETGQLGLFRILVLFLYYVHRDSGVLGNCSFEYLHLDSVVHAKRRYHFIDSLRHLHLW